MQCCNNDQTVSAIIVSYNTRHHLELCLNALLPQMHPGDEAIVVDNGSTDGSLEMLNHQIPSIKVLSLAENIGYAAANNCAFSVASGDFVLLLNSDAYLFPDCLDRLREVLSLHPQAAAAGPKLLNSDGSIQPSCFPIPSPARSWLENFWMLRRLENHPASLDPLVVESVTGAVMLIRRTALEEIGWFDERFFLYAEEADWCMRCRRLNRLILYVSSAEAVHDEGASGGVNSMFVRSTFYLSLDRFFLKWYGWPGFVQLRISMAIGCLLRLPFWCAAWLVIPSRRPTALKKIKLRAWLLVRQTTHFNIISDSRCQSWTSR